MQKLEVIAQLRSIGYRMTTQRAALLDAIWSFEDHFTVEMVRSILPQSAASIDTSTIYRTLELLCQMGVLHVLVGSSPTEYERQREHHHHLVCQECGKVVALPGYHLGDLLRHLEEEHGFVADLSHLAIPGRCTNCEGSGPPHPQ